MVPTLDDVDHIHVFVSDRAAAERWYARVLGFRRVAKLEFWASGGGPLTIANESGTVHIALFERPPQATRSTIALRVSGQDLQAWRTHLEHELEREVQFQDHELSWSLYFADPDGNPFEITTYEIAAAGRGRKPESETGETQAMVTQQRLRAMHALASEELEDWGSVGQPIGEPVAQVRGVLIANEEPGLEAGVWECSPGKWVRQVMEAEFTTFLNGSATFTPEGGTAFAIRAGDVIYWPANSKGVWDIHETLRKFFLVVKQGDSP